MTSRPYLVLPGVGAYQLPSPNSPLTAPSSRGEVVHQLISGKTAVTRRAGLGTRTFTLTYSGLYESDASLVSAFADGLLGDGPFILVDPSSNNVLTPDQSVMGLRPGSDDGWASSAGGLSVDSAVTSSDSFSNVLRLFTPISGTFVMPGASTSAADVTTAAPLLPNEYATFSVDLAVDTGSPSITLALRSYDATTGASIALLGNTMVTVSTTMRRYWFTLAPTGSGGGDLLVPRITVAAAWGGSLLMSAPQLEYSQYPSPWVRGYGAPGVLVTQGTSRSVPQLGYADQTLVLAEAAR